MEYLQQTARARLCLDKAAELLSVLQDGSGRSPFQPFPTSDGTRLSAPCPRSPPSSRTSARTQGAGPCPSRLTHRFLPRLLVGPAEVAEEKRRYLKQVELFCTRVQNDWYRVYLVRKLASQQGMEFVQSLSRRDHPAHWVFPRELLAQQVRSRPGLTLCAHPGAGLLGPPDLPWRPVGTLCASSLAPRLRAPAD